MEVGKWGKQGVVKKLAFNNAVYDEIVFWNMIIYCM